MRLAMDKAANVGVGVVNVYNSGHFGAIGHHALLAAERNMVGVCFTGAGLSVVPTFASRPLIGTNPIAVAAPARNEAPILFDVATSAIAGNKIRLAMRVGVPLLPGWVADKEGRPIGEAALVHDRNEFLQLPLGGTREQGSHKGYGFALDGGGAGHAIVGRPAEHARPRRRLQEPLRGLQHRSLHRSRNATFDTIDEMLETLRTAQPAEGHERVLYPGLSEHEETPGTARPRHPAAPGR